MTTNLYRAADHWWVATGAPNQVARLDVAAVSTRELLENKTETASAIEAALARGNDRVRREDLELQSPISAPCRVVAQMTNYVSHVRESGLNPATVPLTFFRKASGSISGPSADIRPPEHVRFLDYEVEIGLVIGAPIPVGTHITPTNWTEYVAGIVTANDVSARDVQLPKTQFYESKSYPSFTPIGPALVLMDASELARFEELRLTLTVNSELRQSSEAREMIYRPAQALNVLAGFQRLDPGDVLLTGTPGGTALKAPPKPVEFIGSLLPAKLKWQMFFRAQSKVRRYLADGDIIEATVRTSDGTIDAGLQRTRVTARRRSSSESRES